MIKVLISTRFSTTQLQRRSLVTLVVFVVVVIAVVVVVFGLISCTAARLPDSVDKPPVDSSKTNTLQDVRSFYIVHGGLEDYIASPRGTQAKPLIGSLIDPGYFLGN